MGDKLTFNKIGGHFADRYSKVAVFQVSGGHNSFAAFVYLCRLNLDIDGAPTTYGYENSAKVNNRGDPNLQKSLAPLESWHKGWKGVSNATSQKVGLGNACGDPGDGTKGWQNFLNGNRKFYWAGLKAVTKQQAAALKLVIDDRPELEAGLATYAKIPKILPVGSGYFPVVQGADSPAPGYYVSTTSVVADDSLSTYDANRYLNSAVVPYAVWANEWNNWSIGGKKVQQGDYGLAIRNSTGASTGFVFGDSGTPNKVGESSQKLHNTLGGSGDPVTFIAFPGSGEGAKLGKHPEMLVPLKVFMQTIRLGPNTSEFATHLAMGPTLTIPKGTAEMSFEQNRLYKNIMSALSCWTI